MQNCKPKIRGLYSSTIGLLKANGANPSKAQHLMQQNNFDYNTQKVKKYKKSTLISILTIF